MRIDLHRYMETRGGHLLRLRAPNTCRDRQSDSYQYDRWREERSSRHVANMNFRSSRSPCAWPKRSFNIEVWRCVLRTFLLPLFAAAFLSSPISVQAQAFPDGPGKDILEKECSTCHAPDMVRTFGRSPEEWHDVVISMID